MIQQFHVWYISKGNENKILKRYLYWYVYCNIINNSQDTKMTCMSISGWMGKEEVEYMYGGILVNHKKEGNAAVCQSVDRAWGHYTNEVSRGRQMVHGITYMWNLKKSNSEFLSWLSGNESLASMRTQVQSLASLSGIRIPCCRELWCRSQRRLGSALLWLVATAPIRPLA